MKRLLLLIVLTAPLSVYAQSDVFQTFRKKFRGEEGAHYLNVSGFVVRTMLAIADEDEARRAMKDISRIHLMVVPREAFSTKRVTVAGFKRVMQDNHFEHVLDAKDGSDKVAIYSYTPSRREDQSHLMVIESDDNVLLIEFSGFVDEQYLAELVKVHHLDT